MTSHSALDFCKVQGSLPAAELTHNKTIPRTVPQWPVVGASIEEAHLLLYFAEHAASRDHTTAHDSGSDESSSSCDRDDVLSQRSSTTSAYTDVPAIEVTPPDNDLPRKIVPKPRRSPRRASALQHNQEENIVLGTSAPAATEDTTKPTGKRTSRSSSGPSKRRKKNPAPTGLSGPKPRRSKSISKHAEGSRNWCKVLKAIPVEDLPVCYPPKSAYTNQILSASPADNYRQSNGLSAKVKKNHPTLAPREQQFIAAFSGRLSEAMYTECKARIFAAYYWRTEQDGIYHNTETSQQVCAIDVKVSSTLHKWFNGMKMFNKSWVEPGTNARPDFLHILQRPVLIRKKKAPTTEGSTKGEKASSAKSKRSAKSKNTN